MPLSSELLLLLFLFLCFCCCFFVKIVTTPLRRSESRLPRSETVQSNLHRGSPTHKSPPVVILYQISDYDYDYDDHNHDNDHDNHYHLYYDHDNQVRGSPSCRSRGSMQSTPGMSSRGNCCKVGFGVGIYLL